MAVCTWETVLPAVQLQLVPEPLQAACADAEKADSSSEAMASRFMVGLIWQSVFGR
jgi:hypothetical protein